MSGAELLLCHLIALFSKDVFVWEATLSSTSSSTNPDLYSASFSESNSLVLSYKSLMGLGVSVSTST